MPLSLISRVGKEARLPENAYLSQERDMEISHTELGSHAEPT